jgi:chorismate dehydratase
MTSVALLELLFEGVWQCAPEFAPADAELSDVSRFGDEPHDARLVIGDAALLLGAGGERRADAAGSRSHYAYAYDLGEVWKGWTGLPFVFAVWVAPRTAVVADALRVHDALRASRDWGVANVPVLAEVASARTGISASVCEAYLSGLDYGLSPSHIDGLTEFFRRLAVAGRVPDGTLAFLPAA